VGLRGCVFMSFLDALWHLFNFFLPALGMAALLAPALVWGQGLGSRRGGRWKSLLLGWLALSALGALVLLAGLWWHGRDGRMATYAALVVALGSAVAYWRSR